jgi:predicted lipoprotein with Yx(FWY)xxD motif
MLKRIAVASIVLTLVASGAALAATRDMGMGTYVNLHKESGVGNVLATGTGRTLYLNTLDGSNIVHCNASCASGWPPLYTTAKPIAGMGVKQALLHTTKRPNGRLQVTYNGHPLYRYSGDTKAGQANGEGMGGRWFAVTAAGNKK